jgi:hypothetical protein
MGRGARRWNFTVIFLIPASLSRRAAVGARPDEQLCFLLLGVKNYVGNAMRDTVADFLMKCTNRNSFAKFIVERQDISNPRIFKIAS